MNWETTLKKLEQHTAFIAAKLWVDSPVNLQLINNQINCVYRFESHNQGYYLRITHEKIRSNKELSAAINFQQHVFNNQAPICQAIPSLNGHFIEPVQQDDLEFLTHVCLEVPGKIMSFDETKKEVYIAWGQALAKLHRASQTYKASHHKFLTWKDLWQETENYSKNENNDIKELFQSINSWFNQHKPGEFNYGLTHGDHRPGNVLYDKDQVSIIDFDEPVYHWYITDIAKPFLDLCHKPYKEWEHLFLWYLEGYRSIIPIGDDEIKTINWFTQMKSLDIYLWCKNNWFEPTAPGGKPRDLWLNELRQMALTPLFDL